MSTPLTLADFIAIDSIFQQWMNDHSSLSVGAYIRVYNNDVRKGILPILPLETLIRRNSAHPVDSISLSEDIDVILATYFPVIGQGTEALVFDIGTCVLKRRRPDDRTWEFPL